jgi:hypothetical protein
MAAVGVPSASTNLFKNQTVQVVQEPNFACQTAEAVPLQTVVVMGVVDLVCQAPVTRGIENWQGTPFIYCQRVRGGDYNQPVLVEDAVVCEC